MRISRREGFGEERREWAVWDIRVRIKSGG
jgi:hypothetical protein